MFGRQRFRVYAIYNNGERRKVGSYRTFDDAKNHARLVDFGVEATHQQDRFPVYRVVASLVVPPRGVDLS